MSCAFNDVAVALNIVPAIILPLMIFSGFFINADSIDPWFIWISYISPIRYGFIAMVKNEFTGLDINCRPEEKCKADIRGEDTIQQLVRGRPCTARATPRGSRHKRRRSGAGSLPLLWLCVARAGALAVLCGMC